MISTQSNFFYLFSSSTFSAQCQGRLTQSQRTAMFLKDYSTAGRHDILTVQVLHNYLVVILAILLLTAAPTSAKILKTVKQALKTQERTFTVGSGLEYQTDSELSEYDFPFLLEYGLTNRLKLTVEPNCVFISKKIGTSVSGFGELETSLTYDFIAERRYRPGLSAEGIVKWPTASHADLGTGKTDYSLGIIASMEFVHADMDFNILYTFVGSPPGVHLRNTIEASLATEWRFNPVIDLEGELAGIIGSGSGFHGQPGTIGGFGRHGGIIGAPEQGENEIEATLGIAEHLSEFLKLEEGLIVQSDGSWQVVFAWEWDFGGGD